MRVWDEKNGHISCTTLKLHWNQKKQTSYLFDIIGIDHSEVYREFAHAFAGFLYAITIYNYALTAFYVIYLSLSSKALLVGADRRFFSKTKNEEEKEAGHAKAMLH